MMRVVLFVCAALLSRASGQYNEQQELQQFQSVKGGFGSWQPHNPSSADLVKIFQNNNMRQNLPVSTAPNLDVGVCYIEVPTASLVRDGGQIPAGNGSQPHLSRIRSCCKGYIRNIHNFKKCDPVCEPECVNALCTAPNQCTCFPDHVKNLAGFCIATCPIGCQNGHCAGGECLCKEGYKLDADSKYCIPKCNENCGGLGNCTEPNTCNCKPGYESTPQGSCKPHCDKCSNGDCVAPNECRCHQGFAKDQQGLCVSQCGHGYQPTAQGCKPVCDRCSNGECVGPNECRCNQGYAKDQQNQCAPLCTPACASTSRCVAPGVCDPPTQQPYNYHDKNPVPLPNGVPQCAQSCMNGYCIDNNRCRCNPGYVNDAVNPNTCVPYCEGGCQNGVCSGPNLCLCKVGYRKDHQRQCVPICSQSCEPPTHCVAPNVCGTSNPAETLPNPNQPNPNQPNQFYPNQPNQFYPNQPNQPNSNQNQPNSNQLYPNLPNQNQPYQNPDQSVLPLYEQQSQCSQPCFNGVCVGGNRCSCNPGYVNDQNNPQLCVPHCAGGCPNGICSAPDYCICNAGYAKDFSVKGRTTCVKRNKRSIKPEDEDKSMNVAELLVFEIPDEQV